MDKAASGSSKFKPNFISGLQLKDLEDGRLLDGDSGSPISPPEEFDMAKFHRGRQFFRYNLFSCTASMFFSLVIGMSVPDLLEALVFTGESDTPEKAFRRYLSTFRHLASWHYGNVWEEDSAAQKSIRDVRRMHKLVREKMQTAYEGQTHKFLSQYDMGIVQSGFMGAVIMYSDDLGIKCTSRDLDDYVYFWYGIGHALGIQKKYNICAYGLSQALSFVKQIEQDIVCKNLGSPPPDFDKMTNAVIIAFQRGLGCLSISTFPVILALSNTAMVNEPVKLSFGDTVRYLIWKCLFFALKSFSFVRAFMRHRLEMMFGLTFTEA